MNILYSDPSLCAYGYAVLDGRGKILEGGCIRTLATDTDETRAGKIGQELTRIVSDYNVGKANFEKSVGAKSYNAAKALALVQGLTIGVLQAFDVPFQTFAACDIKQGLVGKRDAEKQEVLDVVVKLCPLFEASLKGIKNKTDRFAVSDSLAIYAFLKVNHGKGNKKSTDSSSNKSKKV